MSNIKKHKNGLRKKKTVHTNAANARRKGKIANLKTAIK